MYKQAEIEPKIIEVLSQANQMVTVCWVAENLGVSWATARTLLERMRKNKKIRGIETPNTVVYAL